MSSPYIGLSPVYTEALSSLSIINPNPNPNPNLNPNANPNPNPNPQHPSSTSHSYPAWGENTV